MDMTIILKVIPALLSPAKRWIEDQIYLTGDSAESLHDDIGLMFSSFESDFNSMQWELLADVYKKAPPPAELKKELDNFMWALGEISEISALTPWRTEEINWWISVLKTWFNESIAKDPEFMTLKKRIETKIWSFKEVYRAEELRFLKGEHTNTARLSQEKDRMMKVFWESISSFFSLLIKHIDTIAMGITEAQKEQMKEQERAILPISEKLKLDFDLLFQKMIERIEQ